MASSLARCGVGSRIEAEDLRAAQHGHAASLTLTPFHQAPRHRQFEDDLVAGLPISPQWKESPRLHGAFGRSAVDGHGCPLRPGGDAELEREVHGAFRLQLEADATGIGVIGILPDTSGTSSPTDNFAWAGAYRLTARPSLGR